MKNLFIAYFIVAVLGAGCGNSSDHSHDGHNDHDHSSGTHEHNDGSVHENHEQTEHHQEEFIANDSTTAPDAGHDHNHGDHKH